MHYAAVSRSHEAFDIVKRIAELAPQSLDHADARGRLPLHYAALSPLLPRSNPDGYMVVDDDDDDDPNEIALRTLRYLIRAYPPGVMRKDDDLCVPWHYAQFADSRRGELLLDSTIEADPGLDHYLVPDGEVRWDIVQICHMNSY
uniref:Uncharacterized protein n=1 Tax=Craspedostauros australis TaxID=1486917 RepID=A0A7R9WR29_9STRA